MKSQIYENVDIPLGTVDQMAVAQRMKAIFRRTKSEGVLANISKVYQVPLDFLRDYTIPIGDEASWNKERASIAPITFVFAFKYLNGSFNDP